MKNKSFIATVCVPTLIVAILLCVFTLIADPVGETIRTLVSWVVVGIAFLICFAIYSHKENKKLLSDIYKKLEEAEKKDK